MDRLFLLHDDVDVASDELGDGLPLRGLHRVEGLGVVTKVLRGEGSTTVRDGGWCFETASAYNRDMCSCLPLVPTTASRIVHCKSLVR